MANFAPNKRPYDITSNNGNPYFINDNFLFNGQNNQVLMGMPLFFEN